MTRKGRYPHKLKSFKTVTRPSLVIFLDTETYATEDKQGVETHHLKLGYAMFCRTRRGERLKVQSDHVIEDAQKFWEWVDNRIPTKSTCYLTAHNLNYDLPILNAFIILPKLGWELVGYYTKSQTNIFRWEQDSRKLVMLDNGNFFQGKLEYWGNLLNFPKLDIDFEDTSDEYLLEYCKRDVEIIRQLWLTWLQFLDDNNCGSFKATVASTALNTFRYRFMPRHIFIHCDELALQLEREAYHGGRVECLFVGEATDSTYYYIDVNSMYAFVMSEYEYPYGFYGSSIRPSLEDLERYLPKYSIVANVDLETDDNPFPFSVNKRIVYPVGAFNATLTTPELKYALERNWIVAVWAMAWYPKVNLFSEYVNSFYELRQHYKARDNSGMEKICKLLTNSLYGKFGQMQYHQELVGNCDPNLIQTIPVMDMDTGKVYNHVYIGGSILKTWREGESIDSFPAIAAHVTAYARMHLFSLLRQVPQGHAYYMDTDSLIVDEIGLKALEGTLSETRLGALKIESSSDTLTINSPKDYQMGERVRIKGIKGNAVQLSTNVYRQTNWDRIPGMIRKGDLTTYTTTEVEKTLYREIKSGEVLANGWIAPFVLDYPSELPR